MDTRIGHGLNASKSNGKSHNTMRGVALTWTRGIISMNEVKLVLGWLAAIAVGLALGFALGGAAWVAM